MTKNLKKGDWVLVRAGVLCAWPLLVEVIGPSFEFIDYNVVMRKGKHPYPHLNGGDFILRSFVVDTGYAVKVPKSNNIEMLELLYLPKRGMLDEETQN